MPRFLPKIMQAANTIRDLAHNWRLVWAGSLGDDRSLRGRDGEYAVQVQPPLQVTDQGIVVDMKDERWQLIQPPAPASSLPGGGEQGAVLVKASGQDQDAVWFSGVDVTAVWVTDVRYDATSHTIQKKTRSVTFAKGLLTQADDESDWTPIEGGTASPCTGT